MTNAQHWNTIQLVFGDNDEKEKEMSGKEPAIIEVRNEETKTEVFDKETQASITTIDKCINTIPIIDDSLGEQPRYSEPTKTSTPTATPPTASPVKKMIEFGQMTEDIPDTDSTTSMSQQRSLESQLKQAMMLASTRSALLLETESRMGEYQSRIKSLEKALEEKEKMLKHQTNQNDRKEDNTLSVSIKTNSLSVNI